MIEYKRRGNLFASRDGLEMDYNRYCTEYRITPTTACTDHVIDIECFSSETSTGANGSRNCHGTFSKPSGIRTVARCGAPSSFSNTIFSNELVTTFGAS